MKQMGFQLKRSFAWNLKNDDGLVVKKAKGIQKKIVKSFISHDDYKRQIFEPRFEKVENKRIQSIGHHLFTISQNKSGLSSFDDKRFLLPNGIDTLAHGHYKAKPMLTVKIIKKMMGEIQLKKSEICLISLLMKQSNLHHLLIRMRKRNVSLIQTIPLHLPIVKLILA